MDNVLTTKRSKLIVALLTACVIALAVIDCVKTNGNDLYGHIAVDLVGVLLLPFILFRLNIYEFKKIPYYIWAVCFPVLGSVLFYVTREGIDMDIHRIVFGVDIYLYGFIVIKTLYYIYVEKWNEQSFKMTGVFYLFFCFLLLAVLSVNEEKWPICFLIMFSCMFILPLSKDDENILFLSIAFGLVIAFIVIQGWALLRRPYDEARYLGAYSNANVNAFFYALSCVATFGIGTFFRLNQQKVCVILSRILVSIQIAFCYYTASRSGLLAIIGVTFIYVILENKYLLGKKLKKSAFEIGELLLLSLIIFPLLYFPIRYLPAYFHHPKYFHFEVFYKENRVMPWDPVYSEKYISFSWMLGESIFGRVIAIFGGMGVPGMEDLYEWIWNGFASIKNNVFGIVATVAPMFTEETYGFLGEILGIRKYIYLYYLSKSTWIGNPSLEFAQVTEDFSCEHPHSSFIYMIYSFGYIAGAIFVILALVVPITFVKKTVKLKESTPWYYLMCMSFSMTFSIIGLLEFTSYPGKMIFTMFFLSMIPLVKIAESNDELV